MNNTGVLPTLGVSNLNSGNPRLWLLNIFTKGGNLEVNFFLMNFIKEYVRFHLFIDHEGP
jgi:hypothetical protein